MSLFIAGGLAHDVINWTEWHIGEPIPVFDGRVITFQADGDELAVLIQAIKKSSAEPVRVIDVPTSGGCSHELPALQVRDDFEDVVDTSTYLPPTEGEKK